MGNLLDVLRDEHKLTSQLMGILRKEVEDFKAGDHPDWELLHEVLEYLKEFPDHYHHPKEDLIMHKLSAVAPDSVLAIGDLEEEHRKLKQLTLRFAAALDNVLQDNTLPRDWFIEIASDYLKFQTHHMGMEEVVLFPAASRALNDSDWDEINTQVAVLEASLETDALAERYALLSAEVDLTAIHSA